MATNSVELKAKRYLADGKVKVLWVDPRLARMTIYGTQSVPYSVQFTYATGWDCSCPAHTECAHIVACKLITDLHQEQHPELMSNDDTTALINSIQ